MTLTEIETPSMDLLTPIKGPVFKSKRAINTPGSVKFIRVYFNLVGHILPRLAARQALQLFSKPRSRFSTRNYDDLVAQSEEFHINDNGNRINGRIWDNRGPTILLVHGWESSGLHLGAFIAPLWTAGFRVVIFDGPAHGASQGKYTNLPDFAGVIRKINLEIGPIDHIVSHSFGGFASIFAASKFQQEMKLDKLVLIGVPNKLTRVLSDFALLLNLPQQVVSEMNQIIKEFLNTDPEEIESAKLGQNMNVEHVLVVHDRKDSIMPFHNGLEIVHDLYNAQLLETENLGHNQLLKNPQVISRIVEFIKLPQK